MRSGAIFVGLIWGAFCGALLPYLLRNEGPIRDAIAAGGSENIVLMAAAGFVGISLFFVAILFLVGLVSSARRGEFLSTVVGFVFGLVVGPLVLAYAQQSGWVSLPEEFRPTLPEGIPVPESLTAPDGPAEPTTAPVEN